MTITIVLLLLSSPILAQLNNCTLQFEADSILVQNGVPANSTESLLCGIHVGMVEYSDYEYDNYDRENISWTEAKCFNENTITFNSPRYIDRGLIRDSKLETGIRRFLTFECISSGPINIVYSRHLIKRGNVYSGYYLAKTKQHVTILHVPFESSKSGNYTFELHTANAKLTKWYSVYFNTTTVRFTHPDLYEFGETFDHPDDPLSIVVPCLANGPEQRPVILVNATKNNVTYKYVPGIGIVTEKANFVKKFQLISTSFFNPLSVHCQLTSQSAEVLVNLGEKSSDESLGGSNQILLRINSEFKPECYFQNQTLIQAPSEDGSLQILNLYLRTSSEWRFFAGGNKGLIFELITHGEVLSNHAYREFDTYATCSGGTCVLNQPYKSGAMRCSSKRYQLGHYIGLYFTGLDNRFYLLEDVEKLKPNVVLNMSVIQSDGLSSYLKLYATETILLECNAVHFVLLPGISWILTFRNGTELLWDSDFNKTENRVKINRQFNERLTLKVPDDAQKIQCAALLRDTVKTFISVSLNVHFKGPPTVVHNPRSSYKIRHTETQTVLNCEMKGYPQPTLYWTTNEGKNLTDVVVREDGDGTVKCELTIFSFWQPLQKEIFTCVGVNSHGIARAEFLVETEIEEPKKLQWGTRIIAGVVAGFVGLISAFILVIILLMRKYKAVISSKDISWFLNGDQTTQNAEDEINYSSQPYKQQKELVHRDFFIDKTSILGSGSYGVVMKGHVRRQEVAVKTVKPNPSREVVMALLAEIKIMSSLADHPNVVSYIGAHTTNISKGEVYLFVELCSLGTVQKFLKNTNTSRCESNTPPNEEHDSHLLKRLVNWSLQTVRGMKYLSECRVIHGDLAVRNLLLKDMDTVKITDFGLARQLQNYTIYKKTQQQQLPWRHMSPESLSAMEFSTKSDVWAFGVTMWEMFSLGAIPYTGLQWTIEFTSLLESGLCLDQRKFCPAPIYAVMQKCWEFIPIARPDFAQLEAELEQIYITNYDNDYLDVGANNSA